MVQFIGYGIQFHGYAVIGKQTVCTKSLRSRPGSDVVGVGLGLHHLVCVVLQRAGNEFRSVSHSRLFEVVLVFQHIFAVGEVTEDSFYELLLLFR